MTRDEAEAWAREAEEPVMFATGFDAAIVGIGRQFSTFFVVYDLDDVVGILQRRDGMTEADALEFIEVHVVGAWVGPQTPCFLFRRDR